MLLTRIKKTLLPILLVLIVTHIETTTARPRPGPTQNSLEGRRGSCEIDSKLDETCQRCAKVTKSTVVYPMCCSNEDDAYVWCEKYIGYGIH